MTSLTPRNISLRAAKQFVYLAEISPDGPYYVWVGNPVDPSVDKTVYDDTYDVVTEPYSKMAFGTAVTANDVSLMLREVPYVANVVYTQYDDANGLIFDTDFYVTVTSGDYVHGFKCLHNNNGIPSTIAPDIGDVDPGDIVYQTSDGYQWKYMFTVEDVDVLKFSTPGYIPFTANASVIAEAVDGALDVITVDDAGEGYRNYLSGSFDVADVQVGGNGYIYSLAGNTTASTANGFYTGCIFYMSSGTGAGGYKTVVDYVSNASGKFVVLNEPYLTNPTSGTVWELSPEVVIVGCGCQSSNAFARAVVNTVDNTIHRVEVLDRGLGYTRAEASVVANSVVGVTSNASVRPIYSPPGGHGADPSAELGITRASVSVRLDGTIDDTVPGTGNFGQHGLMARPIFASANLGFSTSGGVASLGATYQVLSTVRVQGGATVTAGANTITCNTAEFSSVFSNGSPVLVKDTNERYLGVITSINATSIRVATNLGWTSGNATVYTANAQATATISAINAANSVVVENIDGFGFITVGDDVIVGNGGHWGTVDSVSRSGVSKDYSTFVHMTKVVGTYTSGTLAENEVVYQGTSLANSTATAWVHSVQDDGGTITVYLTDVFGAISVDSDLKGNTSSAILNIADKYLAELVPGSGTILYVENHAAVTRSPSQAEELNLLLEF